MKFLDQIRYDVQQHLGMEYLKLWVYIIRSYSQADQRVTDCDVDWIPFTTITTLLHA